MANDEHHIALLEQGVTAWNAWRVKNLDVVSDLSGACLDGAILIRAKLIAIAIRTGLVLSEVFLNEDQVY